MTRDFCALYRNAAMPLEHRGFEREASEFSRGTAWFRYNAQKARVTQPPRGNQSSVVGSYSIVKLVRLSAVLPASRSATSAVSR